jgi:hypothetical protein
MRPKTFALLLLAMLCLAPSLAGAAPPSGWIQVKITFDDSYPGAALKSDAQFVGGGETYQTVTVGNKTKLEARINANNGYLFLRFLDTPRKLRMNLSREVTSSCPVYGTSPNYPVFDLFDHDTRQMLSVVDILSVTGTEQKGVRIGFTDEGPYGMVYLHFDEPSNGCSGKVLVTRTGPTTWKIESPVQPGPLDPLAGIAVVWQNFATKPGQIDGRAARYVNLPFKFTVEALE